MSTDELKASGHIAHDLSDEQAQAWAKRWLETANHDMDAEVYASDPFSYHIDMVMDLPWDEDGQAKVLAKVLALPGYQDFKARLEQKWPGQQVWSF
jgi:hypothetical protein